MRFTIRDLFWLTLVVAMGLAWWVDRGRVAAEREQLENRVAELLGRNY